VARNTVSADSALGQQLQKDRAVQEAMEKIAQGAKDLQQAIAVVGEAYPRVSGVLGVLAKPLGEKALRAGLRKTRKED
jgi:hypothetical protein